MADEDLLVTISGSALSLLMYENSRIHDQIGFLLGDMVKYVTKNVTDSDTIEGVKKHIHINCVDPFPISKPFFDSSGNIDEEFLKSFLKDNIQKIVGWYHYREEHPIKTTFRDKLLHCNLSNFFLKENKYLQTKENFIFFLLNSSKSVKGGTYEFKHLLLRFREKNSSKDYESIPVPLKINNLGADVTKTDGNDYKPVPIESSCKSDAFDIIYNSVKNDLLHKTGIDSILSIHTAAEQYLEKIISEVSRSDQLVSKLENELKHLREIEFIKRFEKKNILLDGNPSLPLATISVINNLEIKLAEMFDSVKNASSSENPPESLSKSDSNEDVEVAISEQQQTDEAASSSNPCATSEEQTKEQKKKKKCQSKHKKIKT